MAAPEAPAPGNGDEWDFPVYVGHRRYLAPGDALFETGNEEREELAKQAARSVARDSKAHLAKESTLAGRDLSSYLAHKFECATCHASLPTAHLLSCHVSEVHDSYFAAQAARRMRVYCCLVEACGRKFCTVEERKQHLVDHHRFPRNYAFDRIHLRRKHAQIRPLPEYRKAAPPADAFEGVVGKLGAMEVDQQQGGEQPGDAAQQGQQGAGGATGTAGAAGPAQHQEEVMTGLSRLSVAAADASMPANISFGRHVSARGMMGAGRSRGAGRGNGGRGNNSPATAGDGQGT